MFRIFNRYFSVKHTVYVTVENLLVAVFLLWGTAVGAEGPHLVLALFVCQVCLYYNELFPPFSRFSAKAFWLKHLKAILWAAAIVLLCYAAIPPEVRNWPLFWWRLAAVPFILIGLHLGYQAIATTRRLHTPLLIVGSGTAATLLKSFLAQDKSLGYRVFHFQWDLTASGKIADRFAHLTRFVKQEKIKQVVVALRDRRGQLPVESLLKLRVQGIEVFDAVSFYERVAGKLFVDWLKPSTLIFSDGFNRINLVRISKRFSDIFFSIMGLVLSAPIFAVLAVMIKMTSEGPVFYAQERVGENGRPFMLLKFRSMRKDAEALSGPVWALKDDPRVTPLGKVMRALRLDEIPQMINVLKGEMSFVGPRPERPVFVARLREKIPYYDLRFTVKPGITGWAQVKYPYGATEQDALEKLQYDLYYIKHLSPLFDLTIILETIRVVLLGKGAR